ncbi:MAG: hypothetical protein HY544_03615 [Candidatus Diapherotrites archaeon]|uniref:Uncharacterized protein n=1 Tax=Candidatus Iainarchaeum sp. TaxID=3101447 RepID=A0A8T3YKK4_9ARCH|nr:hypothetical protein [Candidatus Diapherotrites archaeon]
MGTITMSFEEKDEERLRRLAHEKYGSRKGSLSKVVLEGITKLEGESVKERARQNLLKKLRTGFDMGKILYKTRAELHER